MKEPSISSFTSPPKCVNDAVELQNYEINVTANFLWQRPSRRAYMAVDMGLNAHI